MFLLIASLIASATVLFVVIETNFMYFTDTGHLLLYVPQQEENVLFEHGFGAIAKHDFKTAFEGNGHSA